MVQNVPPLATNGLALPDHVDRIVAMGVDHVTITGGEPFARKDLFELLDIVKSHNVGIQIISNGGLIDDAIAIRSICHLSLSFDHRLIDGALADQFMTKVKQVLETWSEEVL